MYFTTEDCLTLFITEYVIILPSTGCSPFSNVSNFMSFIYVVQVHRIKWMCIVMILILHVCLSIVLSCPCGSC